MLDELEWPSLESHRERSSLTFYKIHSSTVSLDKDKYLTPAPNLRRTRASHDSQYTRQFAYNDALKNSFFPRTISVWNSLPSSVVLSKTIEEFKAYILKIISPEACVLVASWYHISNHFYNIVTCNNLRTCNKINLILRFCRHNIANVNDLLNYV